jgi:hypothetical protein
VKELRAALGMAPIRAEPDLFRTGNALVELLARQADGVFVHQHHGLIPAADRAASTEIRTTIPAGKETLP